MPTPEFRTSLHGVPYSENVAVSPPKFTGLSSSPPPQDTPNGRDTFLIHSQVTLDPYSTSNGRSDGNGRTIGVHEQKSASSLRVKHPPAQTSQTNLHANSHAPSSLNSVPSIPQIRVDDGSEQTTPKAEESNSRWLSMRPNKTRTNSNKQDTNTTPPAFQGIPLELPLGSLGDDLHTTKMKFSNRGSMLLDGRKVSPSGSVPGTTLPRPTMATKRIPTSSSVPDRMQPRAMSTDEEMLSEKVRLYYAHGSDTVHENDPQSDMANRMSSNWLNHLGTDAQSTLDTSRAPSTSDLSLQHSPSITPSKGEHIHREELELAGGLEDWQDVNNADVDRYGFIVPKSPVRTNNGSGITRSGTVSGQGLQRVSTSLQLAAEAPRGKRNIRRSSAELQSRSVSDTMDSRPSTSSTARPSSSKSATIRRYNKFRAASNRLPGNKDRRAMDEAGDMFTLPRSLTDGPVTRTATMESDHSGKSKAALESKATSAVAKKKELEREEKWRKMARPINSISKDPAHKGIGGGMMFAFPPTTDAKLVARTWKGIPDTWRAPAWHYFLSVSARKNPQSLPDDTLINLFHEYQDINSPDDVQIDIDVPRTISSHIMFRRRYRGGQRLLFRVLHAMSLHWPETGYVQGMAALAATLLSYYEEEKAFIMLVRLWECRGLGKLYKEGFGGLMEALDDFEKGWLGTGEVAKKLDELNIVPTAYGTRWYLTLFNYSIPFPAQLRVWDVFMLLGDNTESQGPPIRPNTSSNNKAKETVPPPLPNSAISSTDLAPDPPFGTTLDILHATSAALIDGMRDILLDSDFENAMKVLTSWIPVRDEDLFMRVARAEWKVHREKRRKRGV